MGGERVTIKNLKIIRVDEDKKIIAVNGSVPGKAGSIVEVKA
jgi:large subunit ribosomal protein L3